MNLTRDIGNLKGAARVMAYAIATAFALTSFGARANTPNILIVVADDMGWADVGYHGSPIPTPNLDKLCRAGVELDQHYVAPMCTPTRAALLTGRYWSRFGNTSAANNQVLPFETVTLASALKNSGYDTFISGKWHLGSMKKCGPLQFGFRRSHGSLAGGVNPWNHLYKPGPYSVTWHRNDTLIEQEGHVTDLITSETIKFIEEKRDGPFLVYVPFTAPHVPIDEPRKWLDRCKDIPKDRRQFAACVTHLDDSVGQFVAALDRSGQRENTLLIFFSDNGGHISASSKSRYPRTVEKARKVGLNTPLRGKKGQVYEGGIRTPAFVSWPAKLKPRKLTTPLHVTDWMPTLCGLAGYKSQKDLKWDGVDIWPVLSGKEEIAAPRILYTKGPGGRSAAIREGDWKLIRHGNGNKAKYELYHLGRDPNEKKDLVKPEAKRVTHLKTRLREEESRDNDAVPKEYQK